MPCPVGPVIGEHHHVAVVDANESRARFQDGSGTDEFIGFPACVGHVHCDKRVVGLEVRLAVTDKFIGEPGPVPVVIPVHGVVPPYDAGEAAPAQLRHLHLHVMQVFLGALRWGIPSVQKGMYVNILYIMPCAQFQ